VKVWTTPVTPNTVAAAGAAAPADSATDAIAPVSSFLTIRSPLLMVEHAVDSALPRLTPRSSMQLSDQIEKS
jgi:hypothetical protein